MFRTVAVFRTAAVVRTAGSVARVVNPVVVAAAAASVFVVFAVAPSSARAQSAAVAAGDAPVIIAQGEASVKRAPDVAWAQIAVESRASKPEAARQKAADAMTSVMTALKRTLPADAIRTSGFSVEPEMEYVGGSAQLKGYVARNQIEARVDDLEKLAGVLDAAVSSGATSVSGVRFDVKARAQYEREALRLAVEDAMGRAQAMAAGAGRSAGALLRVQEQRATVGPVFRTAVPMAAAAGRAAVPETPVAPGEIEIRGIVTVTVEIR
jgi:uncharacterized protein YggE